MRSMYTVNVTCPGKGAPTIPPVRDNNMVCALYRYNAGAHIAYIACLSCYVFVFARACTHPRKGVSGLYVSIMVLLYICIYAT